MKAMGFDADKIQKDVLGNGMDQPVDRLRPGRRQIQADGRPGVMAQEMKKIEGYPIVIDGKYFPAPKPKAAEERRPGRQRLAARWASWERACSRKSPIRKRRTPRPSPSTPK